jgi:hypothetical protein
MPTEGSTDSVFVPGDRWRKHEFRDESENGKIFLLKYEDGVVVSEIGRSLICRRCEARGLEVAKIENEVRYANIILERCSISLGPNSGLR